MIKRQVFGKVTYNLSNGYDSAGYVEEIAVL